MAKNAWHTFFWMQWFLHVLPKMLDVWIISLIYLHEGSKIATCWWWNGWCRYSDIPYTYMVHLGFIAYFYTTTPPHPKKKQLPFSWFSWFWCIPPASPWWDFLPPNLRLDMEKVLSSRTAKWNPVSFAGPEFFRMVAGGGRGPWYTPGKRIRPRLQKWWWADAKFGSFGISPFVKSSMFLGAMFVLGSVYFAGFGKISLLRGM